MKRQVVHLRLASFLGRTIEPTEPPATVDRRGEALAGVRQHALVDGSRAAAWLIRAHRRQLHEAGGVDLLVPAGRREPTWFAVAIEYLKRRSARWVVEYRPVAGGYKWRLLWRQHGTFGAGR